MKPIKDCEYPQEDGCCGYPGAPTPECHTGACPRLAPFVDRAIEACELAHAILEALPQMYDADAALAACVRALEESAA